MSDELQDNHMRVVLGMCKDRVEDSLSSIREAEGSPVEDDMRNMAGHTFTLYREIGEVMISKHEESRGYEPQDSDEFREKCEELREELYGDEGEC